MTEHAVNNGTSICQTAEATHLILTFQDFCAAKTVGFTYRGQRAELEFHLVNDPKPPEIQLLLYVRNISSRLWHVLTYEDPFNNDSDTAVKELPPSEDVYLYPIREFSFGNRDELIIYFRFDRDAEMLQSPKISQEQLEQLWRRLQLISQDTAFADMTVNGLPAHRAVLAASSGKLHETISNLISNYQRPYEDPATHDPAISNKSSDQNNVDTENDNTEPIDGRHQNDDDPKHCNNEDTVEVKTNNGGNEGNHNKDHQNQDFEKITADTKESSAKIYIQDSADSLNHDDKPKESSGRKRDGNMMSGENSVVNTALISDGSVEETKESRRTEDKKITQDVLLQLSVLIGKQQISVEQMLLMVNNFLTEHAVHEEEIEMLERPQPDNYKLGIFELLSSKSTEMFLGYIYTNSLDGDLKKDFEDDLLEVACEFDLENLEMDTELQILQISDKDEALMIYYLDLAKSYELYTVKLHIITLIRWYYDLYMESPLAKYFLTMPSHHRYQKQCIVIIKVPNISKLREQSSNVFCICGIPLKISVERNDKALYAKIFVDGGNKGNLPRLGIKTYLMSSKKAKFINWNPRVGVWYNLFNWQGLNDPANGCIVDESIELRFCVRADCWY